MTAVKQVLDWLRTTAHVYDENQGYLTDLDSPIGDADHGTNMARGFAKVAEKLEAYAEMPIDKIFNDVGMTLIKTVGGSSGPLYGRFFINAGKVCAGKDEFSTPLFAELFESGLNGIVQLGKAAPGDKTLVDVLTPAVAALKKAANDGSPLAASLHAALDAAETGLKATISMQARKGRASYLGERSIGHQDPGATSTYMLIKAAYETWKELPPA